MSRVQTAKSQQNIRSIEEELEHQIKKSGLLDADRKNFYNNAEETKRKNNEIIDQLKKENKELKKLQDELIANKRVTPSNLTSRAPAPRWPKPRARLSPGRETSKTKITGAASSTTPSTSRRPRKNGSSNFRIS